jgi:hypothetical protein
VLLTERLAEDKITTTSTQTGVPDTERDPHAADMSWFYVRVRFPSGSALTVPYGLGPALTGEPETTDVMSTLLMGVRSVVNNPGYEQWCDEWGTDPETEGRHDDWLTWLKITDAFREGLGAKFDDYLYDTEDDV